MWSYLVGELECVECRLAEMEAQTYWLAGEAGQVISSVPGYDMSNLISAERITFLSTIAGERETI